MSQKLNNTNLLLFLGSNISVTFGLSMFTIIMTWLAYNGRGSLMDSAFVSIAMMVAQLLIAPIGGVIADRSNRKKVIVLCRLLSCVVIFIVFLHFYINGKLGIVIVSMAATFLLTILSTLSGPVQSTILRELVEKEKFSSVYGNFIALSGVSRLVGQGIAGFLLSWIGTSWSLLTILVVFIFGVLLIQFSKISTKPVNNYSESSSKLRELKEGWNYLINIPYLKWLLITACLTNVSHSSLTIAAPAIAKELGNGPQTFSLLTMSLVFGGLVCGVIGGRMTKKIKTGLAFGYLNLLTGLFTIIIAFSNSLILTCAAVFFLSFVITMDDIMYESIVMLLTDSRYRGRIKGLQVSIAMLLMPVAMLFGGYIGDLVGVRNLIIISSAFVFLAAIICFANKHVRSVYSGHYEHAVKNETMQIKL